MANICDIYHLAGLTFNDTSGDTYITTDIQGLDGAPIRSEVDDKPQTDGGIMFPAFLGPRHVTFEGFIGIRSQEFGTNKAAYIAVMDYMEEAMIDALESIRPTTYPVSGAGTLYWTGHSLTVYHDSPVLFRGDQFAKRFVFGLVAPDPTISDTS